MILQVIAAFFGTIAFALLFGVPRRHYVLCGVIGMIGWAIYLLLTEQLSLSPTEATFAATVVVALLSRVSAVWQKCPVTVFSICGIFPLIPGGSIYRCTYAAVIGQKAEAASAGVLAAKIIFGLVVGLVLVQDIPAGFFSKLRKEKNET